MGETEYNVHEKHRERMRRRVREFGMDSLLDHELLEYLLYFTIPRGDVNPVAHRLLHTFRTLSGVFDAGYDNLLRVEGIGPKSASLLSAYSPVLRRYALTKMGERLRIHTKDRAVDYAKNLYIGATQEILYLLCLNVQCELQQAVILHKGTLDRAAVTPRTLIEEAIRFGAKNCILVHNHLSTSALPSEEDVQTTQSAVRALQAIDVAVLDHLILSPNGYFSFAANDLLKMGKDGYGGYISGAERL